jgi:hypothetical protein
VRRVVLQAECLETRVAVTCELKVVALCKRVGVLTCEPKLVEAGEWTRAIRVCVRAG